MSTGRKWLTAFTAGQPLQRVKHPGMSCTVVLQHVHHGWAVSPARPVWGGRSKPGDAQPLGGGAYQQTHIVATLTILQPHGRRLYHISHHITSHITPITSHLTPFFTVAALLHGCWLVTGVLIWTSLMMFLQANGGRSNCGSQAKTIAPPTTLYAHGLR